MAVQHIATKLEKIMQLLLRAAWVVLRVMQNTARARAIANLRHHGYDDLAQQLKEMKNV